MKKTKLLINSSIIFPLFYFVWSMYFFNYDYALKIEKYYTYLCFVFFIILTFINNKYSTRVRRILFYILYILIILFVFIKKGYGVGKLIYIFWPIIIAYLSSNFKFCEDVLNIYKIISLVCLVICYVIIVYNYFFGFTGHNPNNLGTVVGISSLTFIAFSNLYNSNSILNVSYYIIAFFVILLTGCRSAMLALTSCLIIYIILKKKKIDKKICFTITTISICLSFIIPIIYIYLYTNNFYTHVSLLNKYFYTGRELIWLAFWDAIKSDIKEFALFGIDKSITFSGTNNIHNSLMIISSEYGLIVLVIYICALYILLNKTFKKYKSLNSFQFNMYLIILFYLITSIFEFNLIWLQLLFPFATSFGFMANESINSEIVGELSYDKDKKNN